MHLRPDGLESPKITGGLSTTSEGPSTTGGTPTSAGETPMFAKAQEAAVETQWSQ